MIAFTAEDDVWAAPLDGGRAWRVSSDDIPVDHPRISPDGTHVAWTSRRDGAPEVHVGPLDGGPTTRLTHWGSARTGVRGWTPGGEILAVSAQGQASLRRTLARAVPLDGGPAATLPYGPVGDVAHSAAGVLLLSATMGREAAGWKRYRGGTAGKLWIDREGAGEFTRIHEDLARQESLENLGNQGDKTRVSEKQYDCTTTYSEGLRAQMAGTRIRRGRRC
ncbi:conserved hypothetical protein [Streptomyces clavuligerus]|nr:conserved hypothetical protein [Streptomyces clavuligerus]